MVHSIQVRVHRKPKIAILSTGSELIDLSTIASTPSTTTKSPSEPSWSGIYDSNRPSLKILIESMGWEVIDLGVVRDEYVFYISHPCLSPWV
jgi:gephyrin